MIVEAALAFPGRDPAPDVRRTPDKALAQAGKGILDAYELLGSRFMAFPKLIASPNFPPLPPATTASAHSATAHSAAAEAAATTTSESAHARGASRATHPGSAAAKRSATAKGAVAALHAATRNVSAANAFATHAAAVGSQAAAAGPTKTAKVQVAGLWAPSATEIAPVGSQVVASTSQAAEIHVAGAWATA